ncbi:cysteine synthase family protein [Pigmentibacter ruber]|uniref:cysteine synthase family protein n=1 Tax=Pigmentibacter ruber TaxID=2683196 RepID=UPI00131AACAA|nr:cysteine synthase family protein [Pigmentibacter ruber]BFD31091.1 pyridoxal-phosphate dependent enzyme [Pigmentibacter ruber]
MKNLYQNVMESVGNVPTVRLNNISEICKIHKLYLKLESCNPGGSIKEKNAVYLIEQAEKKGLLSKGGIIVESSSGNFGIGLAIVGAAKNYKVFIVVDAKTPSATRKMLEAYGATLIDVPLSEADANGSMQVARMKKAEEIAKSTVGAWYPCQHKNSENPTAHSIFTAQEIVDNFAGAPDAIVIGLSTSGQLTGIGSYFKKFYPNTKIIAVDVAGSSILGTPPHPYKMTGLGLSFTPPQFNENLIDIAYSVKDNLAFSVCHALAKKEGLLLGGSTGAIVAAGVSYALTLQKEQSILMINPDRGDRYLDTIYNKQWIEKQNININSLDSLQNEFMNLKPIENFYYKKQSKIS